MEGGDITDAQISSSGQNYEYYPWKARLHNDNGFWSAEVKDEIWLQIDFLELVGITGIQTQGASPKVAQWVKSLQIHTGHNADSITPVMNGSVAMVSNVCLLCFDPITINDNDMLSYSLTTMMCFLTKE